jgi:hypothetical protein
LINTIAGLKVNAPCYRRPYLSEYFIVAYIKKRAATAKGRRFFIAFNGNALATLPNSKIVA